MLEEMHCWLMTVGYELYKIGRRNAAHVESRMEARAYNFLFRSCIAMRIYPPWYLCKRRDLIFCTSKHSEGSCVIYNNLSLPIVVKASSEIEQRAVVLPAVPFGRATGAIWLAPDGEALPGIAVGSPGTLYTCVDVEDGVLELGGEGYGRL